MYRINKHIKFEKELWTACVSTKVPVLTHDAIHVWKAKLSISLEQRALFWSFLSEDEQIKAKRFYFEKDRFSYIAGRGILRTLIGAYTKTEAGEIAFSYTKFGKPSLSNNDSLHFNVSHSGSLALFAFTQKSMIGVDIEKMNPSIDFETITRRFFSKNEAKTVLNLPTQNRADAFYKCWTRKEAFIKGHGHGLSLPLDQFEVSILDENPVALKKVNWSPSIVKEWRLYSFEPCEKYRAALIINGKMKHLSFLDWQY